MTRDECLAIVREARKKGERPNLSEANLHWPDLSEANLSKANLSGATGLLDPIAWLDVNIERDVDGYIVYKTFGAHYVMPETWGVPAAGIIISEVVNPLPTLNCACGVNVATLAWVQQNNELHLPIWRCRIRWAWAASIVVPYATDDKFRCGRLELIEEVTA